MPKALPPDGEARRLRSLQELGVLDTSSEEQFEAIVKAASIICGVPISLISLIDEHRQWFKANVGLPGVTETHRDSSFCSYAIHGDDLLEVEDARNDPRFSDNPLVMGDPNIRFYAGAPLRLSSGVRIGALCVIDDQPRELTDQQREILILLAKAASIAFESRRMSLMLAASQEELRKSQVMLMRTGEIAGVGGWELDLATETPIWTQQIRRIHGVGDDYQPQLTEAIDFYAPEARPIIQAAVRRAMIDGKGWDLELPFIQADGTPIWVRTVGNAEFENGRPARLLGAFQDITERVHDHAKIQEAAAEISEQHELLRVTLESIGDAVITTDAQSHVTWLNPVAERMTGWTSAEAVGRPLEQVFHIVNEETRLPTENPVRTCLLHGKITGLANHTLLISRDGDEFGIEDSAAPIRDAEGVFLGVVLVFHDVTEQRRLSGEMTYRATHDALTNLFNRAEFEGRLQRVFNRVHEENNEHALLYIDLDQFKLVNDTCGHSIGDQLLQQVAGLFAELVRSRDSLCRIGGDEFAVILEDCNSAQALKVAQKICDRMEDYRFHHDGRRFRIGASIGLVPIDNRWGTIAAVMQAADTSCYAAKEAGRNRVHAWFDTDTAMRHRHGEMQWATQLEQALDEDRFVLFGQVIRGKGEAGGKLRAEVLIRMQGVDGALSPPGAFLPAAERFHLASRIDRWVLRHTIKTLSALPDLTVIESLSVNLSGHSVGDRAFHRQVIEALKACGSELCERICFEITETAAITNMADAALFIEQVRALGVRIALDDFGAGASSFGYLKSLSIDYLKIDGQFIKNLMGDALADVAVRCFVDVARVVGVKTVAEFVENEEILDRITDLGVDFAQGYLIHRPEPLASLLKRHFHLAPAGQPLPAI